MGIAISLGALLFVGSIIEPPVESRPVPTAEDQNVARYGAACEEAVFYRDPHVCTSCRYRADDMLWRCPQCHSWNSFVEERVSPGADR